MRFLPPDSKRLSKGSRASAWLLGQYLRMFSPSADELRGRKTPVTGRLPSSSPA